ncbi:MAG: beta-galactosidase, partial [Eubacteriales bacterium]|nr:beta-galactosidase [Eubacteriales bacterium]
PNLKVSFRVQLDELWSRRYFLPVFPGSFKGHVYGLPTDPRSVGRVEIRVTPGKDFADARLSAVYVADEPPGALAVKEPLVDEMGQRIGCEWTGKTRSLSEMTGRLRAEYQAALASPPDNPRRVSDYGGYLDKRFPATGWFRTQHDGQRWWLVDPEGYAFFSHGMCYGARMGEFGWFSGMEGLYRNPPSPEDPLYAPAFTHPALIAEYVKRHGETSRSMEWMYNPARANMIRTFGRDWWDAWRVIAARRFRGWGVNTMGVGIVNFVDERVEDFLRLSRLPYTVTLKRFPVTEHFIFRDFPDVFSQTYRDNSRAFAQNELAPLRGDPYLVGYFLHNEPEWMFQSDCNVAYELLVKEEPLESRSHMAAWLAGRYQTIERLNAAWGIALPGFDSLLRPLSRTLTLSPQAWKDLEEYEQTLILAFGQIPLEECRRVDANHLCLGLRHGGFADKVVDGSSIFDVFSFNCYRHSAKEMLRMAGRAGKPVLIGEWHFGGQDVGLMRTALQSCVSQEERGKAYRVFLEEAAADPLLVGAHYFEYNDQSLLGRFDGEHMAHGVIDCTNRPYAALARAIGTTSDELYDVLTGRREPCAEQPRYLSPHW